MTKFAVAVINGTQARFFTLDSAATSEYESGPNLIEHECLSDSTKELQGRELWANTKTGRNRGLSGQDHSYDKRAITSLQQDLFPINLKIQVISGKQDLQ